MADCRDEHIFMAIIIVVFVLLLILLFPFIVVLDPTFTAESSTVKAYNLTSDDDLFCILEFAIRAHNPNTKYLIRYRDLDLEVRKGKHHKLADDAIWKFKQHPKNDTVLHVEAVGLHVRLERKIAAEMREDVAAGEGKVNIFMTGRLPADWFDVEDRVLKVSCKDVAVDFSRSTARIQKVNCRVRVYSEEDIFDDHRQKDGINF